MKRSHLVKLANRHIFFQYALSILPILLILVYVFSYMYDLMDVFSVVTMNDTMVKQHQNAGYIALADSIQEEESGYKVHLVSDNKDTVDVYTGQTIYTVMLSKDKWFSIITENKSMLVPKLTFVRDIKEKDDGSYDVTVLDKTINCKVSDILYEVSIADSGNYKLSFTDDTSVEADMIDNLNTIFVGKNYTTVEVYGTYTTDVDSLELSYVSALPTNDFYYDAMTHQLLKNIEEGMDKTFMMGSKLYLVTICMIMYWVLIILCFRNGQFTILSRKEPTIFIGIAVTLLGVLFFVTKSLL